MNGAGFLDDYLLRSRTEYTDCERSSVDTVAGPKRSSTRRAAAYQPLTIRCMPLNLPRASA